MLIWVHCSPASVIGFTLHDIAVFERDYENVKDCVSYWGYFNWYFEDQLHGKTAICFSSLWDNTKALAELERLRVCRI